MSARDFCTLLWSPRNLAARTLATATTSALAAAGWREALADVGVAVWLGPGSTLPVTRMRNGSDLIIGETFMPASRAAKAPDAAPGAEKADQFCKRLMAEVWGRYVVIMPGAEGALALFRDPSGALDCLTWRRDGLTLVASATPAALDPTLPEQTALDWRRVAAFLANPIAVSGALALEGLTSVAAGMLWLRDHQGERSLQLWRPIEFIEDRRLSVDQAREGLVHQVQLCVGSWAQHFGSVAAELSGGLDSAIVAALLARSPAAVAAWINYHVSAPEADERRFAADVADKLGIRLTAVHMPDLVLSPDAFGPVSQGPRPAIHGMDWRYDQDMATRAQSLGVRAILTGQGGDAVFFQMLTDVALADRLRVRGPLSVGPGQLLAYARATKRSIWDVGAQVARAGLIDPPEVVWIPADYVSRDIATDDPTHPWLADLEPAPPAKRRQIRAIANCQSFYGDSRRADVTNVIHPLLSQPLVEYCLSLPVADLTLGGRDRGLAREAFSGRLPASIYRRRSKGVMTSFYGRAIARSLNHLRPLLLEGRLAANRLIDRDRLERLLHPDELINSLAYADIMQLVMIEVWVQAWERRLDRLGRRA